MHGEIFGREPVRSRTSDRATLHRLHRGVYAVGHLAPIEWGAETAALLAYGDDAVLSFEAAGALWGIPCRPGRTAIDVTVPGRHPGPHAGIRIHHTRQLDARDVRIHERLPVTAPARTLLDLAEVLNTRALERALDEALALRLVRRSEIQEVLLRSGHGRRGATTLRSLLENRAPDAGRTRWAAEDRFDAMIRAAELPRPERNARLYGFTVDFLWREQGVAVEVDGYQWHSTKSAFERDRRKDGVFKNHRVELTRVTWESMDEEPLAIVARLSRALAERGAA